MFGKYMYDTMKEPTLKKNICIGTGLAILTGCFQRLRVSYIYLFKETTFNILILGLFFQRWKNLYAGKLHKGKGL